MSGIYYKDKLRANVTIPNPQDTATADLEKVKIDGTTYAVGGADALSDLTDTAITSPSDGDVLQYDSTDGKWENKNLNIPTVNDNTITIQLNGTTIESFTLNQSSNETINIQVTKSDVGLGNVPNVATDDQTPTVTEASTRANLASGDTLKTIIGKIKKFFSDLKTVAFTGSYTDLTDQPTIPVIPSNNITGSGTSGKLTKWNGANSITDGPALSSAVSSQTQSTKFLREDGTWSAPSYTTNTDEKVKQENTTGSADYRVLLSNGANDTTETKTARKSANLKFNPSTGNLQATQLNGVNIGSSPKFTDNDTTYTLSADTTNNKIKLTPSSGSAQSITVPYATSAGSATDGTKLPLAGGTMTGAITMPNTTATVIAAGANEKGVIGSSTKYFYESFIKYMNGKDVNLGKAYSSNGTVLFYNSNNGYWSYITGENISGSNKTLYLPNETGTLATQEWVQNGNIIIKNSISMANNTNVAIPSDVQNARWMTISIRRWGYAQSVNFWNSAGSLPSNGIILNIMNKTVTFYTIDNGSKITHIKCNGFGDTLYADILAHF